MKKILIFLSIFPFVAFGNLEITNMNKLIFDSSGKSYAYFEKDCFENPVVSSLNKNSFEDNYRRLKSAGFTIVSTKKISGIYDYYIIQLDPEEIFDVLYSEKFDGSESCNYHWDRKRIIQEFHLPPDSEEPISDVPFF